MRYPKSKILALTAIALLVSCTKFEPVKVNKVSTGSASSITQASGTIEGSVLEKGDKGIDQHGFYYATQSDPSSGNYEKTELGVNKSTGTFSEIITGLEQGTSYYYRAYVKNSDGEVYGDVMSFLTLPATTPSVSTTEITSISQTSAVDLLTPNSVFS